MVWHNCCSHYGIKEPESTQSPQRKKSRYIGTLSSLWSSSTALRTAFVAKNSRESMARKKRQTAHAGSGSKVAVDRDRPALEVGGGPSEDSHPRPSPSSGQALRRDKPRSRPSPRLASAEAKAQSQHEAPLANSSAQGLWEDSAQAAGVGQSEPAIRLADQRSSISVPVRRFSNLQKILIVCIVFIAALLVYEALRVSSGHVTDFVPPPSGHKDQVRMPEADPVFAAASAESAKPKAVASPKVPLSLTVAEAFYLQKDYNRAYADYNQLRQALAANEQDDPLKDFLQLKMAFCMKKAGNIQQADQLFRTLLQSPTPAIRTLAAYQQIFAELENKQYWQARTRAYQAIALVETIDFYRDWALTLERECHFFAAESLTRDVLSLCDADKDIPPQLWRHTLEGDPFINVSESQLRSVLNAGRDQLRKALLGPQIQPATGGQSQGATSCWKVSCCGAPIEELLARFAGHANLDIRWAGESTDGGPGSETIKGTVRNRPVNLYLSAATPQQLVTVAAGCAGLIAQLDDRGTVRIFNPADYSSLSEHLAMLCEEAVSLWQRFLLTSVGSDLIVNAHFALGLLKAQKGQLPDALAEYKLVANHFSQTPFAPYALLHSSKLKVILRDYSGAREDLKQLTELYPDSEFSDQACLYLADATMKAGLLAEGARLFCKAYNLGFSAQIKIASALGAGRCFYEQKDYAAAAEWLSRFISLAKDSASADFNLACLLLGKTYLALGKPEQATDALEYALYPHEAGTLAGRLPKQEYIEAVSALVDARIQQGHFIEALEALEQAQPWQFSQKESVEMLLLKSKVLRSMGLFDKAILVLADRAEYLLDTQLKAKVLYELAKCHIAEQDLELALKNLTEVLVLMEPGPFAHEARCELAEVCLRLGRNSQAVTVCEQLLNSAPSAPIRQRAMNILATAYLRQKNYEGAVLALLGQPCTSGEPGIKSDTGDLKIKGQKPAENAAQQNTTIIQ